MCCSQSVHVPREVVWLNGAPGAGKGANTQHILKTRGLDHSVCLSTLLVSRLSVCTVHLYVCQPVPRNAQPAANAGGATTRRVA